MNKKKGQPATIFDYYYQPNFSNSSKNFQFFDSTKKHYSLNPKVVTIKSQKILVNTFKTLDHQSHTILNPENAMGKISDIQPQDQKTCCWVREKMLAQENNFVLNQNLQDLQNYFSCFPSAIAINNPNPGDNVQDLDDINQEKELHKEMFDTSLVISNSEYDYTCQEESITNKSRSKRTTFQTDRPQFNEESMVIPDSNIDTAEAQHTDMQFQKENFLTPLESQNFLGHQQKPGEGCSGDSKSPEVQWIKQRSTSQNNIDYPCMNEPAMKDHNLYCDLGHDIKLFDHRQVLDEQSSPGLKISRKDVNAEKTLYSMKKNPSQSHSTFTSKTPDKASQSKKPMGTL